MPTAKNAFRRFSTKRQLDKIGGFTYGSIVECPLKEETLRFRGRMETIPPPTSFVLIAVVKTPFMVTGRMTINL